MWLSQHNDVILEARHVPEAYRSRRQVRTQTSCVGLFRKPHEDTIELFLNMVSSSYVILSDVGPYLQQVSLCVRRKTVHYLMN